MLAAGSIAAGGTLGILIPPSTIMVIYGIMTDTSIGKLFAAGILPGLRGDRAALRRGAVHHLARSGRPARAPSALDWRERFDRAARTSGRSRCSSSSSWAASTAASSPPPRAPASARSARSSSRWRAARSRWRVLFEVLVESARTTSMLFMILVGALIFANFVNYTTMPADLKALRHAVPDASDVR